MYCGNEQTRKITRNMQMRRTLMLKKNNRELMNVIYAKCPSFSHKCQHGTSMNGMFAWFLMKPTHLQLLYSRWPLARDTLLFGLFSTWRGSANIFSACSLHLRQTLIQIWKRGPNPLHLVQVLYVHSFWIVECFAFEFCYSMASSYTGNTGHVINQKRQLKGLTRNIFPNNTWYWFQKFSSA